MPSIIPSPGSPGISPNFTSTYSLVGNYAVPAGTTYYGTGLWPMYRLADYDANGVFVLQSGALFFNNGTLWNRSSGNYAAGVIVSFNFDHITNNGLMVAEAILGVAWAIDVDSTWRGLTNYGQIYAISNAEGAIAVQDWSPGAAIVNYGLIAAQRVVATPDPANLVYQSFAILRYNGGPVVNDNSGSILSEGAQATAVRLMRGHIGDPGNSAVADVANSGLIEAASTDARFASTGLALESTWNERMQVLNSGTIRADVAITLISYDPIPSLQGLKMITNLASGVIDGAIAMTFTSETVVNRGVIDGKIDAGDGIDMIENSGTITGQIDLGAGADLYIGAGALAAARVVGGTGTDLLIGGAGSDRLEGGDGNDWLQGGGGADLLIGGAGADRFVIAAPGDSSAAAADTIQGFESGVDKIDLTAIAPTSVDLSVAGGVTTITANAAGGAAVIRVEGAVTLVDLLLAASGPVVEGTANAEALSVTGAVHELHGGAGNDVLGGSAGNDILDGGTGEDIMYGGLGDDIYYVDNPLVEFNNFADPATDRVIELEGGGTDEVRVSVAYTLDENVENVTDIGAGGVRIEGNGLANLMVGNAADNILSGNGGDDVLIGGAGADSLEGGGGVDRFVYRAASDSVAGAFDTIYSFETGIDKIDLTALTVTSISWSSSTDWLLSTTHSVTVQTTAGIMNFAVRGIQLTMTDFIYGEPGRQLNGTADADVLVGGAGNDILNGFAGNDVLVGGAGADIMAGGTGDDVYYFEDFGDMLSEFAGEGNDRVAAVVSLALAPDSDIERIEAVNLTSTNAMDLTGSRIGNVIYGNDGANILRGEAGNDELRAFGGNDFLVGGDGIDLMVGGAGDDTYYVNDARDVVGENAGEGNDRIATSVSYFLSNGADVEILEAVNVLAPVEMDLTGSDSANTIIGNSGGNVLRGEGGNDILSGANGNDVLVGGAGDDIMNGGRWDDIYYVDSAGDVVNEYAGEGTADRVSAAVSYTLAANADIERLDAANSTDTSALDLTGSNTGNAITGNDGANVLDGRDGNDVLTGLGGADTFRFTTAAGANNVDTIVGFVSGSDRIALDDAVFAQIGGPGALNANAYFAGTAAHDADDRIIYNQATGALLYDADGNGAGAAIQFASLNGAPALAASDFMVI